MIIRTNRGVVYNGPADLKVGDKIRARFGANFRVQTVTELNPEVRSYDGAIWMVSAVVERALPAGIDDEGDGDFVYHDLAHGDDTLSVRFYDDGEPTFYTSGDDTVILTEDQVKHLVKILQELR